MKIRPSGRRITKDSGLSQKYVTVGRIQPSSSGTNGGINKPVTFAVKPEIDKMDTNDVKISYENFNTVTQEAGMKTQQSYLQQQQRNPQKDYDMVQDDAFEVTSRPSRPSQTITVVGNKTNDVKVFRSKNHKGMKAKSIRKAQNVPSVDEKEVDSTNVMVSNPIERDLPAQEMEVEGAPDIHITEIEKTPLPVPSMRKSSEVVNHEPLDSDMIVPVEPPELKSKIADQDDVMVEVVSSGGYKSGLAAFNDVFNTIKFRTNNDRALRKNTTRNIIYSQPINSDTPEVQIETEAFKVTSNHRQEDIMLEIHHDPDRDDDLIEDHVVNATNVQSKQVKTEVKVRPKVEQDTELIDDSDVNASVVKPRHMKTEMKVKPKVDQDAEVIDDSDANVVKSRQMKTEVKVKPKVDQDAEVIDDSDINASVVKPRQMKPEVKVKPKVDRDFEVIEDGDNIEKVNKKSNKPAKKQTVKAKNPTVALNFEPIPEMKKSKPSNKTDVKVMNKDTQKEEELEAKAQRHKKRNSERQHGKVKHKHVNPDKNQEQVEERGIAKLKFKPIAPAKVVQAEQQVSTEPENQDGALATHNDKAPEKTTKSVNPEVVTEVVTIFTLEAGFWLSSLATTVAARPEATRLSRTRGVRPMSSVTFAAMRAMMISFYRGLGPGCVLDGFSGKVELSGRRKRAESEHASASELSPGRR